MKNNPDKPLHSLSKERTNEQEDRMLESLLATVRRRKRQRYILRSATGAAALFALAAFIGLFYRSEPSSAILPPSTPVQATKSWGLISSRENSVELIQNHPRASWIEIETPSTQQFTLINDSTLLDLFKDRPVMLAQSSNGQPAQIVFLDEGK